MENNSIIQDEYLSASHDNWNLYARYGRLNNIGKAWAAIERDREPGTFLQISIGRQLSVITAVATQGHDKGSFKAWVLTYKLRFSAWGDEWMDYTDDGKVKVSLMKIDARKWDRLYHSDTDEPLSSLLCVLQGIIVITFKTLRHLSIMKYGNTITVIQVINLSDVRVLFGF